MATLTKYSRRFFSALIAAGACAVLTAAPETAKELSGDKIATPQGDLVIHPVEHGTLVLAWKNQVFYVDPVGGAEHFKNLPPPDVILITDIHPDHMDAPTLSAVAGQRATIVAPQAVASKLPETLRKRTTVLANDQTSRIQGVQIRAVPMYNLTPERLKFHDKGRGNGYVLEMGGKRLYISGDTEDIPEMRALKGIDVAFVCMNLPYTMTVEQAASAVREFKPAIVYPYHYRGTEGLSDIGKFKDLVGEDTGVEVRLRDWYPK